jgi:hypothetical protein
MASLRQQVGDPAVREVSSFPDQENLPPLHDTPPPSGSGGAEPSPRASSSGGCLTVVRGSQWAGFAHRLRGSPTPSSSSRSSATTADTFLLEDVSGVFFYLLLALLT